MENIIYPGISPSGLKEIKALLQKNNLPHEDIDHNVEFISAYEAGKLIGCIGVEKYGDEGLLRSFAVEDAYRGRSIGNNLLVKLLEFCRRKGIKQLHLLTTTADEYFLKKGFEIANRESAPAPIKATTEFSLLCPSSSVYMRMSL